METKNWTGNRLATQLMGRCTLRRRSEYVRNLDLARKIQDGCPAALEYLKSERLPPIIAVISKKFFVLSTTDLEDIHTDTWTLAWARIEEYDPLRDLDPWLYGIAKNVARDYSRRWYPRELERLGSEPLWQDRTPGDDPTDSELEAVIDHAIGLLPPRQQTLVRMDMRGHMTTEIQVATGCPSKNAVYVLRRRTRIALRAILEQALPHLVEAA